MAMGNIESFHNIVNEELVNEVVGAKLLSAFQKQFDKASEYYGGPQMSDALNGGQDGFNEGCSDIDPEEKSWVKVQKAYDKVTETFKAKTGLNVSFIYFSGEGDHYDDLVNYEWYWVLETSDVWVPKKLTKKAKEFQKKYGQIDTDQRFSCYG